MANNSMSLKIEFLLTFRLFVPFLLLSPLYAEQAGSFERATSSERPNIVIILADDLGYGDPGCYNDQSKIPTPHIDQLALEGLRLTDAHTPSSVCTPTRYGLLTGRYCWRSALKSSVLWPWAPSLIEPDRLTLPAMVKQHDYRTACIGKWHLGWEWPLKGGGYFRDKVPGHNTDLKRSKELSKLIDFTRPLGGGPLACGFDYYFGDDVPNFPPYCFIENDRPIGSPTAAKPKEMFGLPGPAVPGWDLSVVMPTLTQRAARYLREQAEGSGEPFFLYMPLTAPHTPIAPSPHFIGKSEAGWYGDFVHEVDWTVGQVMDVLKKTGLAENTLVIFTSDNGSPQRDGTKMAGSPGSVKTKYGHDPSRPWRGMKADIWEGGHRVPFIARWPGHVPEGTTSAEPIVLTDLMRSIATILGHELPENAAEDSFDILPLLLGEKRSQPIRDHLIHHSLHGTFSIRQGPWKLILGRGSGGFSGYTPPKDAPPGQLYHLDEDPSESKNLYRERPEVVERLRSQLEEYREQGRTFSL